MAGGNLKPPTNVICGLPTRLLSRTSNVAVPAGTVTAFALRSDRRWPRSRWERPSGAPECRRLAAKERPAPPQPDRWAHRCRTPDPGQGVNRGCDRVGLGPADSCSLQGPGIGEAPISVHLVTQPADSAFTFVSDGSSVPGCMGRHGGRGRCLCGATVRIPSRQAECIGG